MLRVKVGEFWLSTIGSYGPVTVEFGLHGSEAASWEMSTTASHPALRGNALVRVYDGGLCIWAGNLIEPGSDGQYSARGLWRQAETVPALNSSGAPTTFPTDAITQAFTRGDISWAGGFAGTDAAWAAVSGEVNLSELLDSKANELGQRWVVWPNQMMTAQPDPTVPMWNVPHAVVGRGLVPADDDFVTHLVGTYLSAGSTYSSRTIGSASAASVFGRRTKRVDLTPMGVISAARADSVLTGMFLLSGARMGWGEGLDLGYGQITTRGSTPATLAQVQAGQMIRLSGVMDTSRASLIQSYTDIVIGTSKYTDGSDTISLTPVGYAPRNLEDVLTVAVAGEE